MYYITVAAALSRSVTMQGQVTSGCRDSFGHGYESCRFGFAVAVRMAASVPAFFPSNRLLSYFLFLVVFLFCPVLPYIHRRESYH